MPRPARLFVSETAVRYEGVNGAKLCPLEPRPPPSEGAPLLAQIPGPRAGIATPHRCRMPQRRRHMCGQVVPPPTPMSCGTARNIPEAVSTPADTAGSLTYYLWRK